MFISDAAGELVGGAGSSSASRFRLANGLPSAREAATCLSTRPAGLTKAVANHMRSRRLVSHSNLSCGKNMLVKNLSISLQNPQEDTDNRDCGGILLPLRKFLNRCICSRWRNAMTSRGIDRSARRISDQMYPLPSSKPPRIYGLLII